ncbi:hypothetical protein DRO54_01290 [Candidatus Bathyarchaeota archaeon]|nr:MAG: hypothetical protein DRO54_01290 [Candidatus Bathyarchaeota archaeon]
MVITEKMLKRAFSKLLSEFSFIKGNLLTLIVSWIFMDFTFSMTSLFESPYIRALGASPFVIGLMNSAGVAVLSLVRIFGAYIADKYGRKQIIVTMTFGIAISYLFYTFAPDWRFILLGMLISNLCLIYQPALEAIHADSIPPEKRGLGYAASNVIPNIPAIFAPAIAGYLVEYYGLVSGMRLVYFIVFLCMLTAAIIRFLFLKETLPKHEKIRFEELKGVFKESLIAIKEAWNSMSKSLKFLTVALLVSAFEEPMFRNFTSLYVFDVIKVNDIEWGIVNAIWIFTTLVFGLPLGKIVDKIGRKNSILVGYLIFTPSSILFIFCRNFPQLLLSYTMFALGGALINPAYNALQADMIPREKRGRVMGTIGTLNVLATIPASALGGYLYEVNPAAPFVWAVILGIVVSCIIVFGVREPGKKEI